MERSKTQNLTKVMFFRTSSRITIQIRKIMGRREVFWKVIQKIIWKVIQKFIYIYPIWFKMKKSENIILQALKSCQRWISAPVASEFRLWELHLEILAEKNRPQQFCTNLCKTRIFYPWRKVDIVYNIIPGRPKYS